MKKIVIIFIVMLMLVLVLVGCGSKENVNEPQKETATNETSSNVKTFKRVEVDSLLYKEFSDLKTVWKYEPKYGTDEWMDDEGKLLFPYEKDKENMKVLSDALAVLYMPESVLVKANTQDLYKVVMEGWLESNATSVILYSHPSEFIQSCTGKNQATNELLKRSDMVNILYEEYCNMQFESLDEKNVDKQRQSLDKIQFVEIILASNHAFSLMDEEMKEKVLKEAIEKNQLIKTGKYYTGDKNSGFFSYISEEELKGGSDWYKYICDNNIEQAKESIVLDDLSWNAQFN